MMKYSVFILVLFAVEGVRCQNCTRTNSQPSACVKSCVSQDDCKGSTRECLCDGDCGYSCVKKDLRCKRLTINNGRVRQETTFGSVARYRCNPPYRLVGAKKRTCRGNGEWDGTEPICKLLCVDPGAIPHGKRKHNGFELGKQVKYSCMSGFTMQGSSTLTCTRTGAWDNVTPRCTCERTNKEAFRYCRKQCNPDSSSCSNDKQCVCDGDCGYSCVPKAVNCGRPSALQNGRQEYSSTTFGSTVRYQCDKPYTLLGSKVRTCRAIRRWDGTEPSCKIVCQDPGDIANGNKQIFRRNYDEDYVAVGDRAEYNCFPGYNMEGSKYLACTRSGQWDQDKPKCVLPSCESPKLPDNSEIRGSKKDSYKYSEKVLLKCKTGYFSIGFGLMTCGSQGWTSRSFTCNPKSCGDPGDLQNGRLLSYIFTFKSKVYFECDRGYKLVGDKYRQCQANEKWSGRQPKCEPIDCGVLPTPDKGEKVMETHTRIDGVVRFRCNEKGYEINGSEIRTCGSDGRWSGRPTFCQIISCGDPGTPANGAQVNVKNGYNYGSSVEFTCNNDYTLSGRSKIYCEETKDWSSPIPRCRAPCPDPGVPSDGSRQGDDFRHGKSVKFKCKDNYKRRGKATIHCDDGMWSDDTPQCTGPCPDPGVPDNGNRIGNDFRHGESVKFECDDDFEMEGKASIRCHYGTWTDNVPKCKVITCADPGRPVNGRQAEVSNNFAVGGFVRFECNTNYTLVGQEVLICKRDQTWNKDIPKCLAPCVDPGHPINGRRIGSVFLHDSVVQFECNGDRLLKGSSEMTCDNGQWNAESPTCPDCFPLGMESGRIPDSSIKASSQTGGNPAHHGRLGRDTYWCSTSDKKRDHIKIRFPARYKITEARVQFMQNSDQIKSTVLTGEVLPERLIDYHYEKPPYNSHVERIVAKNSFIAQALQIKIIKKARVPVCLRAEVHGCVIPRGCIMRGSAVLIKENSGYIKGNVGGIYKSRLEVLLVKTGYAMKAKDDVILDEKPNVHDLAKGTLVLGEDVNSPGKIREGKIEQINDSVCIIISTDKRWTSNLNDVRVFKKSDFCS